MLYTVTVLWGNKQSNHSTWSKSSALSWLYKYPNQDVFIKVTDMMGKTVAIKYHR
jgi:hypothetical protein